MCRRDAEAMSAPFSREQARLSGAPTGSPTSGPDLRRVSSPSVDFSEDEYGTVVGTDIPARLDALPWSRFHTLVVVALGITWILDGLEVTLTGALAGVLKESSTLGLNNAEIGLASSAYLAGAVVGALFFGWLTDRFGRKTLFFITLAIYLTATAATALSWNFWSFALFRAATGAGIGGEAAAVSSTIQELVPARMRGWTDLAINGSFWIGAAIGAAGSIALLDPDAIAPAIGWRLAYLTGAVLGLAIFFMRFWIPESPRWLMTHGQARRAEAIVAAIESRSVPAGRDADIRPRDVRPQDVRPMVRLRARSHTPLAQVLLDRQRDISAGNPRARDRVFLRRRHRRRRRGSTMVARRSHRYRVPRERCGWLLSRRALMIAAASVEWRWGIAVERRPLEQVCRPLTFID
jgi:hypothetical protein